MLTLTDPFFWFNLVLFFVVAYLIFTIPGQFLLRKISLTLFQKLVIGTFLGLVVWGLVGEVGGFFHIRWISYIYVFLSFFLWLRFYRFQLIEIFNRLKNPQRTQQKKGIIALILVGSLAQLAFIWPNGLLTKEGIYFCCGIPDTLYQLALTNELVHSFPPQEPGIYGVALKNYHFFTNIVVADMVRVFSLPLLSTFYQYFSLLITVGIGATAVVFCQLIKAKKLFISFLLFFLYFSGDIIYLFILILTRHLNLDFFFLYNASQLWISPSRALAIPIFFTGLSLLVLWISKKNIYQGILMAFVFGSLISIKTYMGIFALGGLVILGFYFLLRRGYRALVPLFIAGIIGLALYIPVNADAGGLIFTGFWRVENYIAQPVFNLGKFELARMVYVAHHSWLRVLSYDGIYSLLYGITIFGTLCASFFQTKRSLTLFPKELNIFLLSGIVISAFLGFFFIQKTGGSNSSQFIITIFIVLSLYAACAYSYWIPKLPSGMRPIIVIMVVVLTLPRMLISESVTIEEIINHRGFVIENQEIQALNFLKNHTPVDSLIVTDEVGLGFSATCNYISIFSKRPLFVCNGGEPGDRGVDTQSKKMISEHIFSDRNSLEVQSLLLKNSIHYIYLTAHSSLKAKENNQFTKKVFSNNAVTILQVLP